MRATRLVNSVDLAWLNAAYREIATADNLESVKEIRDEAEAVRRVLEAANAGLELQNRVAEVKLRAERRAGELLRRMCLRGGDRRSKSHDENLTLKQMGIDRNRSSRWQREALVPETCFQEFLEYAKENNKEISSAALLRYARKGRKRDASARPAPAPSVFRRREVSAYPDSARATATSLAPGDVLEELENQLETLQSALLLLQSDTSDAWTPTQIRTCKLYIRQSLEVVAVVRRAMSDAE